MLWISSAISLFERPRAINESLALIPISIPLIATVSGMGYMTDLAGHIGEFLGDERVPEDGASLLLLYALLTRTKGSAVTPEDIHDAWVTWCELRGREHPSAVPFDELSPETQAKDVPFADALRAVAGSAGGRRPARHGLPIDRPDH